MPSYGGLLEHRCSKLTLLLKSTFNAESFMRRLPCLSQVILVQFTPEMCVASKIAKNSPKPPIFRVQCHSRTSMLVPPKSSSALLVMISRESASICNRSHTRQSNSGKIAIFLRGGTHLWCPSSKVISTCSGTKFNHSKLETLHYHSKNPESLSHLGLNQYQVMTDR